MSAILKCFKKVIKECDCFGTFVTFRINKDNELKSVFGGCSNYSLLNDILCISICHIIANAYRIVESGS